MVAHFSTIMANRSSSARASGAENASVTARLAALLAGQAGGEGFSPSRLPGVRFMRSTLHVPRTPVAYEPSIVIIAQGRKFGHLGGRTFVYDASHYLVLSVPLPFECETVGTPDRPLLGLSVNVSPGLVAEMLLQMERPPAVGEPALAINSTRLDDGLGQAAIRLLECLRSADDARILGPQVVREITYRVLTGPLGVGLRALAAPHSHFGQITRVLHRMHADYARAFDMETLAREAGMAVSTFHAHFKAVTSSPPLQYLKTIRLHKARLFMVNDGASAAQAAGRVGYESASQFSREFKRLFGTAPAAAAAQLRASLVSLA